MQSYPERFYLFAAPPNSKDEAIAYIKQNRLTNQDVKILANDEETLVVTKKDIMLDKS